MADTLYRFPLNENKETTHKSNFKKEIISEINDTKEIPEEKFPIYLQLIKQHQPKYSILLDKYKEGTNQNGYFRGGSNIHLKLRTCEDNIFIP